MNGREPTQPSLGEQLATPGGRVCELAASVDDLCESDDFGEPRDLLGRDAARRKPAWSSRSR
jgi:hypothetical protein